MNTFGLSKSNFKNVSKSKQGVPATNMPAWSAQLCYTPKCRQYRRTLRK